MHGNFKAPAPGSREILNIYRTLISLDTEFVPQLQVSENTKDILREAIRQIFDTRSEQVLDLHLETFLTYFAKTEQELLDLLQLTASSCSIVSLTETALNLTDAAYLASLRSKCRDQSLPDEVLALPKGGRLEIHSDLNEFSDVEVTICLTDGDFLPPASNYRSYRLHAGSGPRMRRDCELIYSRLVRSPWAIATRGYFLPFKYVLHCRTPFIDSDVSLRHRLSLREAYISALELARSLGTKTIEVPMISIRGSSSTFKKIRRGIIEAVHAVQNSTDGFDKVCLIGCSEI
jgi:hypothetical protein